MVHGLVLSYNQESDLHQARLPSKVCCLCADQSCILMAPISHGHVTTVQPRRLTPV